MKRRALFSAFAAALAATPLIAKVAKAESLFASGGHVGANAPYIVGEGGGEFILPNKGATILIECWGAGGGGGRVHSHYSSIIVGKGGAGGSSRV